MKRVNKDNLIQLRIDKQTKQKFERISKMHNMTLSSWILDSLKKWDDFLKITEIYKKMEKDDDKSYSLAYLRDLLNRIPDNLWTEFLSKEPVGIDNETKNYIAAMVDQIADERKLTRPQWIYNVEPLQMPFIGSSLLSLRLFLLVNSKVAFRKRDIFIDYAEGRI